MNKFIAVQVGARRNYAVPSILESADMLEFFYTDMCADAGLGHLLSVYCPKYIQGKTLQQLLNRKVPSAITHKVNTCDWSAIQYFINQKLAGDSVQKKHKALTQFSKSFGKQALKKGLGKATHVFSMFGEGIDLLREAKRCNITTVTEIYLSPRTHRIVQVERAENPDLETVLSQEIIERDYEHFRETCQLTDVFLVPSKFVQEGLSDFGVSQDRCRIVPYAVNNDWFKVESKLVVGRVLFVGTAELRKGIHILGQAAEKLAHLGCEFRVAGGVSDAIRNSPMTQNLTFLGRVPRSEIQQEYASADVFVLPSLAEGSAEVIYEALATGLPVITTAASGSVVRDQEDGFIIPEKSSEALANCIEKVVRDRELRNRMSTSSRARAKEYTWEKYSDRLLTALSL